MANIEWFRVVKSGMKPTYQSTQEIICGDCLRKDKPTLLNRVFGSTQTCARCGATDAKGGK